MGGGSTRWIGEEILSGGWGEKGKNRVFQGGLISLHWVAAKSWGEITPRNLGEIKFHPFRGASARGGGCGNLTAGIVLGGEERKEKAGGMSWRKWTSKLSAELRAICAPVM